MMEILNIHPLKGALTNKEIIRIKNNLDSLGYNEQIFEQFMFKIIKAQKDISYGNKLTEILNTRNFIYQLCNKVTLAYELANFYYDKFYPENSKENEKEKKKIQQLRKEELFKENVIRYYETNGNDEANIKLILYNDNHTEVVYESFTEKSIKKLIIGTWKYEDSLIILNFSVRDSTFVLSIFDTVDTKSNAYKLNFTPNSINIKLEFDAESIYLWKISSNLIVVSDNYKIEREKRKQDEDYDKVFTVVHIPAEFQGGIPSWTKYLERNLNRDLPVNNGAPPGKYTVVVSFIVDKKGEISEVQAENDSGFGTKDEAVRIIKNSPSWKPAIQNGHPVKYRHKQSITFYVGE